MVRKAVLVMFASVTVLTSLGCKREKQNDPPGKGAQHNLVTLRGNPVGTVLQFVCDIPDDVGSAVRTYPGRIDWPGGSESFSFRLSKATFGESASTIYEEFLASVGEDRIQLAQLIDEQIPETSYQVFTLLHLAHTAAGEDDLVAAETLLVRAVQAAPDALLADVARLRLARVLQQGDRSDEALTVLGAIRGEGFRSHVAELKGDIHLTRGETLLAHEAYNAALGELSDGDVRPLLEMKAADTASANDA